MSNDEKMKAEERALWDRLAWDRYAGSIIAGSLADPAVERIDEERVAASATRMLEERRKTFARSTLEAPETGLPAADAQHRPLSNGVVQPFEKLERFDGDLVEKLWQRCLQGKASAVRYGFDSLKEQEKEGIRAILAELAKMSVELPTPDEIAQAWHKEPSPVAPKVNVAELVAARVVPVLVAKHARIAELEARAPANSCSDSERAQYEQTIRLQNAKIAELDAQDHATGELLARTHAAHAGAEAQVAELSALLDGAREAINAKNEQIERLEKRLAEHGLIHGKPIVDHLLGLLNAKPSEGVIAAIERLRKEMTEERRAIRNALGQTSEVVGTLVDDVAEVVRERDELRAKFTPIDVDGKTPGRVAYEQFPDTECVGTIEPWHIYPPNLQSAWEVSAQAVLRAFGPGMVREALERVRDKTASTHAFNFDDRRMKEHALKFIDAEIAKLEASKPLEQVDVAVREVLNRMTAPWTPMVRVPTGQEFVGAVDNGLRALGFELKRPTSIHWRMVDDAVEGLFEKWQAEPKADGLKHGD